MFFYIIYIGSHFGHTKSGQFIYFADGVDFVATLNDHVQDTYKTAAQQVCEFGVC